MNRDWIPKQVHKQLNESMTSGISNSQCMYADTEALTDIGVSGEHRELAIAKRVQWNETAHPLLDQTETHSIHHTYYVVG